MSSVFDKLVGKQLITDFPSHIKNNIHYECVMGSVAYGVSSDMSDMDVYGFSMPPKHILFPYSFGNIVGFGKQPENFEQFQKHHILDSDNKEYDITIYSIVKFFQLCMENNPNMVDALFVPTRCVLHSTQIGNHVRENRKEFLSKRVWHKFKGYAFSQLHKMRNKWAKEFCEICKKYDLDPYADLKTLLHGLPHDRDDDLVTKICSLTGKLETNGVRSKRLATIMKYGYDVKFGYHVVRLLDECQQILEEGDLDITRSREHLKAIRRGEWSEEQIVAYFDSKIVSLEEINSRSTLRYAPDEERLRTLLYECFEMHYGNLDVNIERSIDKYVIDAYHSLEKAMRLMK